MAKMTRKPLGMSTEEFNLINKIDAEADPTKKAALEAQWRNLDNDECDEAEKRLALSEFGYKKWGM